MNPVEISHLTKHYPDFSLNDVTFSVPAGYVTGFVGANGSGEDHHHQGRPGHDPPGCRLSHHRGP